MRHSSFRTRQCRYLVPALATIAFSWSPAWGGIPAYDIFQIDCPSPQDAPVRFGLSVAVAGDLSGDGVPEIAVAAPFYDNGEPIHTGTPVNVGVMFLINGADFSYFDHSNPLEQQFAKYGYSDGVGDLTGDGIPDLVVSAHFREFEDLGYGIGVGEAFVVNGATRDIAWSLDDQTKQAFAKFGWAVADLGDFNGDGKDDQLISAPFKDVNGYIDVGQAYIYSGADASILAQFDNPLSEDRALFGYALTNGGDTNGDLINEPLIGAPGQNRAYLLIGDDSLIVSSPEVQQNAQFGFSVAGSRDVSGDGIPDIVVGAPQMNVDGRLAQGEVYLFNGLTGALLRTIAHPEPQPFCHFGFAVMMVDDTDADGTPDVVASAPNQNVDGVADVGRAYLFSGATGDVMYTFNDQVPQVNAQFGHAMTTLDMNSDGRPDIIISVPQQDVFEPIQEHVDCPDMRVDQGAIVVFRSK